MSRFVDGAEVLYSATGKIFGIGHDGSEIVELVIARYEAKESVYLFACNFSGMVVGDLLYDSVDEAKLDAERYYEVSAIVWKAEAGNQ